jgi:3-deoxy-D-manno-octulosonic acid kinase
MLADPAGLGNPSQSVARSWFDPKFWSARGELEAASSGRGSAWFIGGAAQPWVLRHYRRGGFIASLSQDRYVWLGEPRVRAFAEWRLLAFLAARGLPVPKPIAAFYQRTGLTYRCDLITQRILHAQSLSAALAAAPLSQATWHAVGVAIARLHRSGVDHADLNAHNILLDAQAGVSVIDFDRGRLRPVGPWTLSNLRRLQRSLAKLSRSLPADRIPKTAWDGFLIGYRAP